MTAPINDKEKELDPPEMDELDQDVWTLPPAGCIKQKDRIYFLKTHKTASSVIENIMYR